MLFSINMKMEYMKIFQKCSIHECSFRNVRVQDIKDRKQYYCGTYLESITVFSEKGNKSLNKQTLKSMGFSAQTRSST